jgi:hypothetical protein
MKGHDTITAAAAAHGMRRMTLSLRLQRAAERGLDGNVPKVLPPGQKIAGVSTLYKTDELGRVSTKLEWVKTKSDRQLHHMIDACQDAFDSYEGKSTLMHLKGSTAADLATLYTLADLHLGLYAWAQEAGESFDIELGCKVLRTVMQSLVRSSPDSRVGILLGLGDFFHSDSGRSETTKGTHVDMDTRYARVMSFGIELQVEMIYLLLEKHEIVEVRNLKGNHDEHSSIALTAALAAFFRNNPRVHIDECPAAHWVYQHGKTLLAGTHGDMLKKAETMALWLAANHSKMWGECDHRYMHSGHIHHITIKEVGGAVMESHRSLSARDAWHSASGYVAGRGMTAITYSKTGGEVSRQTVNIPHWSRS